MTAEQGSALSRDIRDSERERELHGQAPLTRCDIYALVLGQDREGDIEQTKLRGLIQQNDNKRIVWEIE